VQSLAKLQRQLVRLAFPVKRDGFADVVDHDLAGIAPGHVLLEVFADGGVNRAIHVFIQHRQQFFALHDALSISTEPASEKKLHDRLNGLAGTVP
jgi:hypothetical protein